MQINKKARAQDENQQAQEKSQSLRDQEEMEKQAAERLLRSLEGQEQVYGMPPRVSKLQNPPTRDW